jgi:glycosyltransferase involved in cell wall biosynthesis
MKISVVTPVFNGEKYLEQTILSVLAALPKDSEYLIVDDGSTDATSEIIAKYSKVVRSYRQGNFGEAAAVNLGVRESRGEYICIVNADDLIDQDLLLKSIKVLEERASIALTYPDWKMIDECGDEIRHIKTKNFSRNNLIEYGECLPGPGAVIRRSAISEDRLRNPKYVYIGDYESWLRLSMFGDFERIPQELAAWRTHEESLSSRADTLKYQEHLDVVVEFFGHFNPTDMSFKKAIGSAYYKAAMSSLLSSNIPRKKYLFLSLWNFPRSRSLLAILYILTSPFSIYTLRLFKFKYFKNKTG